MKRIEKLISRSIAEKTSGHNWVITSDELECNNRIINKVQIIC